MADQNSGHGFTLYYLRLQRALDHAIDEFDRTWDDVVKAPPLGPETFPLRTFELRDTLEEKRATAVLLAAACVEGVANLYLRLKTTPPQLDILERSKFLEKWTVIPTLFVPGYSLPKDGELYQDLRRLQIRRNAIAHLKEEVTVGDETIHESDAPAAEGDEHVFIRRCRTLALRLIRHVASCDPSPELRMILMTLALKPETI